MSPTPAAGTPRPAPPLTRVLVAGTFAGFLAGLAMLLVMALGRLLLGVPTPTEMIFDRLFPKLTVQFFIDQLVAAGGYTPLKLRGVFGALAGQLAVAIFGGAVYAWFVERVDRRAGAGWRWLVVSGVLAATLLFTVLLWPQLLTNYRGLPPASATVVTIFGMLVAFGVCGAGIVAFYRLLAPITRGPSPAAAEAASADPGMDPGRRAFLAAGAGAALALALGAALRRLYAVGTFAYDGRQYAGPKVQKITPVAPEDEFYQVSKNLVDPKVVRDSWRLEIRGEVEHPLVFTFAELAAMPAVEQETTLQCISYSVHNGLISNAVWKGVPLPALLAQAKPKGTPAAVLFHAADGYYETFRFEKALEPTSLVAYEMNGQPLPHGHGFPLRLIIPGLYGEKQSKWLTRIELVAADDARLKKTHGCGFYKEQGWGPNDVVPTTSRFDAPQVTGDHFEKPFPASRPTVLRGIAFGGDRGIAKVEVSFDDGAHWTEATITEPGTRISWSLWTLPWTPEKPGDARLVVRATDGDGRLQIAEDRNPVPSGATGLHRVRARVEAA